MEIGGDIVTVSRSSKVKKSCCIKHERRKSVNSS